MRERLFGRLASREGARETQGFSLLIDADDIVAVWDRFPGLDPGLGREALPDGVLLVRPEHLAAMASVLSAAAGKVASVVASRLAALANAWQSEVTVVPWPHVAEMLVAGLGLGCAVPRLAEWRGPAVFAVDWSGQSAAGAKVVKPAGRERPPFLRLAFLPGAGAAGLALLESQRWPSAASLAANAAAVDWGQTFASYVDKDEEIVAYGVAGQALVSAGVFRKQGISLQAKCFLNVPAVSARVLRAVESPWRSLVGDTASAVSSVASELHKAIALAFDPGWRDGLTRDGGDSASERALACDYLDAAYFVLADIVYEQLLAAGSLGRGEVPRNLKVRAALLERPAAIWDWLREEGSSY